MPKRGLRPLIRSGPKINGIDYTLNAYLLWFLSLFTSILVGVDNKRIFFFFFFNIEYNGMRGWGHNLQVENGVTGVADEREDVVMTEGGSRGLNFRVFCAALHSITIREGGGGLKADTKGLTGLCAS